MKIESVDHVTINVLDANESIRFYGEVLGLVRLPSVRMQDHDLAVSRPKRNTWLINLVGCPLG